MLIKSPFEQDISFFKYFFTIFFMNDLKKQLKYLLLILVGSSLIVLADLIKYKKLYFNPILPITIALLSFFIIFIIYFLFFRLKSWKENIEINSDGILLKSRAICIQFDKITSFTIKNNFIIIQSNTIVSPASDYFSIEIFCKNTVQREEIITLLKNKLSTK